MERDANWSWFWRIPPLTLVSEMSDVEAISKLKTYAWHGDKCFFVSTIERDSSAMVHPPPRFNETLVWDYDYATSVKAEIVAMAGGGPAFDQHFEVCRQLCAHGKYVDAERECTISILLFLKSSR